MLVVQLNEIFKLKILFKVIFCCARYIDYITVELYLSPSAVCFFLEDWSYERYSCKIKQPQSYIR